MYWDSVSNFIRSNTFTVHVISKSTPVVGGTENSLMSHLLQRLSHNFMNLANSCDSTAVNDGKTS